MGRIAEEDKIMAAQRRRPKFIHTGAPCKDCPNRKQNEDGAKVCEAECELWQTYIKERDAVAEKMREEKDLMSYCMSTRPKRRRNY